MADLDKALKTQIANVQQRTGKTMAQLHTLLAKSGLSKHGELRDWLKTSLGMGHGDANLVVTLFLQPEPAPVTVAAAGNAGADDAVLDAIYVGPKAALRPIHDKLMAAIRSFGDFEVAPKKGYVSLRRNKQFAMLGPATNTRFELGLNIKGLPPHPRLTEVPAGGMCNVKVKLTDAGEVDADVIAWARAAYDAAV